VVVATGSNEFVNQERSVVLPKATIRSGRYRSRF
jgi:hypothetical protein